MENATKPGHSAIEYAMSTVELAQALGCRRETITTLCETAHLPHRVRSYKTKSKTYRVFNLEEVRRFLAEHPEIKIRKHERATYAEPLPGSDAARLLHYLATTEHWKGQPACRSAARSFLAHAGDHQELWTEQALLAWEDGLRARLRPSTTLLYVTSIERLLREVTDAGLLEIIPISNTAPVRRHRRQEEAGGSTEPTALTVDEPEQKTDPSPASEPDRSASEAEESLLDELFLAFNTKAFAWTTVYQASRGSRSLTIALEDVGLTRDCQQWGYRFNSFLGRLQGRKFSSGLAVEAHEAFKGFRPMSWSVVKPLVAAPVVASPTSGALEEIRRLIAEGIIGNVLTGTVADQILSLSAASDGTMTVLGKAFAAGHLNGQQLDWLAQKAQRST